jgi:glutathione S-transferase
MGSNVPNITLYFAPDSCARVPLIALEEIGCPYHLEPVKFMAGQHRSPEYLALNPKGKVPTLVVGGRALTENVAILHWLANRFPHARLLSENADIWQKTLEISDLAYCASGLHPLVTRLRIPQFFCDTAEGAARVFAMADAAMRPQFSLIDQRLATQQWWYGEDWSIVDAYINWVWFRVSGTDFDVSEFRNFARHDLELRQRPAVIKALQVNSDVAERLAAEGLAVKFNKPGVVGAPDGARQ